MILVVFVKTRNNQENNFLKKMNRNFKTILTKIALKNKFIHRKHLEYFRIYNNSLVLLSEDSIWVYTLMKSGTTYTLLFLANYINYLAGNRNAVSFDEMQSKFILHSLDGKIKEIDIELYLKEFRELKETVIKKRIIHTHEFFNSTLWDKNISLYRNPLDFIISKYYYFYINRGLKVSHPRKIYKELLDHFIITYNHQLDLKKNYPEKVLSVAYEDLMKSPKETFKNLISFMGLKIDNYGIEHAMKFSSKKEVKKMERERGEAIVKKDGINFKGSFVRSGEVGEWKSYFNDKDINNIRNYLAESGIDYDDFIYE